MEITGVDFGIYSPEEILAMSVCEIKYDKQKKPSDLENTLYDPRMGPIEDDKPCPTCKKTILDCPGHFGHIVLNAHLIYPLTYGFTTVVNTLKCFCAQCSRLLFTPEKIELLRLDHTKGPARYQALVNTVDKKIEVCWNCGARVARYFVQNPNTDPKIVMYYRILSDKAGKENTQEVEVSHIEKVFAGIIDSDLRLFGFNPARMRPKNLIISVLPVMPTCSRPPVIAAGERCEDDITTTYRDITKHNDRIITAVKKEERAEAIKSLGFYVKVLMDNSKGRVKQPNGRPKSTIRTRLTGKPGLCRSNMMGKRTNSSARTVVGGDPTLEADQVAVPDCIATRVTYPEAVTLHSRDRLSELVNSGQAEFVVRTDLAGNKKKINLSIACLAKGTQVAFGDQLYRKKTEAYTGDLSQWRDPVVETKVVKVRITERGEMIGKILESGTYVGGSGSGVDQEVMWL